MKDGVLILILKMMKITRYDYQAWYNFFFSLDHKFNTHLRVEP